MGRLKKGRYLVKKGKNGGELDFYLIGKGRELDCLGVIMGTPHTLLISNWLSVLMFLDVGTPHDCYIFSSNSRLIPV